MFNQILFSYKGNYGPKQGIYSSFRRYKAFFESKEEPNFKIDTLMKDAQKGYSKKISFYDKNYSILKLKPVLKTQSLSIDLLPNSLKSKVLKLSESMKIFEKERRYSCSKNYSESYGFEMKRMSKEDVISTQISKNSDFFHRHTKTFNDSRNDDENINRKLKYEMGVNNVEINQKEKSRNLKKYTDFFGVFNFLTFNKKKATLSSVSKEESELLVERSQEKQIEEKKLDYHSRKNNNDMKDQINNNNNNDYYKSNKSEYTPRKLKFIKSEFKEILKEKLKEKSTAIVNGKAEKKKKYLKYMGNRYNSFDNLIF